MYESDSDADDYEGILKKALDVELPKNYTPNKPPQTGEEYLHYVMYERMKCEAWVTADVDRSKFKDKQTFKLQTDEIPSKLSHIQTPSAKWQDTKIAEFKELRKFLENKVEDSSHTTVYNEATFISDAQSKPPTFSELTKFAQVAKIRMLQIITAHLTLLNGKSIDKNLGSWIYGILALLDTPLSPSCCHSLREFAKECINVRNNLDQKSSTDLFVPLNLFICIVSRFFNQLDLAD